MSSISFNILEANGLRPQKTKFKIMNQLSHREGIKGLNSKLKLRTQLTNKASPLCKAKILILTRIKFRVTIPRGNLKSTSERLWTEPRFKYRTSEVPSEVIWEKTTTFLPWTPWHLTLLTQQPLLRRKRYKIRLHRWSKWES